MVYMSVSMHKYINVWFLNDDKKFGMNKCLSSYCRPYILYKTGSDIILHWEDLVIRHV